MKQALLVKNAGGGTEIYPAGYKHKVGSLVSGATISIPTNVIPLTILVYAGSIWSNKGEISAMTWQLAAGLQVAAASRSGSGSLNWGGGRYYLPAYYNYDYDAIKNIKTISQIITIAPSNYYHTESIGAIVLTEWLEK